MAKIQTTRPPKNIGDIKLVAILLAIISATGFALVVIIAFSTLARPFDAILTAFNGTFADYTGMTGNAWNSYNSMQNSFRAMWFPIAGVLLFFAIFFVFLHAQRREYVTGEFRR